MNAKDVLMYGHQTFLQSLEGLPPSQWETPGVCGYWTAKDVVAHLASYERMLVEMVAILDGSQPGPILRRRMEQGDEFNDSQVAKYQGNNNQQVLETYQQGFDQASLLVANIPAEKLRQVGTLPDYGLEYAFDDMLVYQYYGHKREHSAQINAFVDRLGR